MEKIWSKKKYSICTLYILSDRKEGTSSEEKEA